MTEHLSQERALSVRVCVCLSVCHSLLFEHYSADLDETGPHDLIKFLR